MSENYGLVACGYRCMRWLRLPAACQHQWLIRTGHRYLRNDVNHSMWPALIGQEIDDSVDLTPGDMFHHMSLSFIGDDVFSFRNRYTLSSYAGGVCVFSQSGHVISTETDECSQTTAEWLLLGVTLTEIDERQRICLVQRTIDATAKNCNANYSGFSRFPHGPVANKFCCPARYFYYIWTCLNLKNG